MTTSLLAAVGVGATEFLLLPFALIGFALTILWIVFPFRVISRLDRIVTATERTAAAAEQASSTLPQTRPPVRIPGIN